GRLVVVHEDNRTCGLGAEVVATVVQKVGRRSATLAAACRPHAASSPGVTVRSPAIATMTSSVRTSSADWPHRSDVQAADSTWYPSPHPPRDQLSLGEWG